MAVTNVTTIEKAAGMDVGFQNLSYIVQLKSRGKKVDQPITKTIISDCSGVCAAGRLLAIMGPSGAGKTSLLDVLAGRKSQSSGELSLGQGGPATPMQIQRHATYVQQDDAIMATQTAREALVMAALLTLPRSWSKQDKFARVDTILKTFHLVGCAGTLVGDPNGKVKGLSGGERKRTAVAMATMREPKIIFLDEPTSGLDSFKALTLVQVLKAMASESNSNVICTIHQPSSDIFAIVDDLMLILNGNVVFHGEASKSVNYFSSVGYTCPQYANPADFFFMHVLTTDADARIVELAKAWAACPEVATMANAVTALFAQQAQAQEGTKRLSIRGELANPEERSAMGTQLRVLFRRGFNDITRNPMRGKAFIAQSVVMGGIISMIWFQVSDDQNGVQDREGVLFFMITNTMMTNVMGVLTTFGGERAAVLREMENGMYTTLPYFTSRVLADLPLKVLGTILFGTISYTCVGFQLTLEKYLTYMLFLILLAWSGNALGMCLACIFPDVAVALAIAPLVILPLMVFSGFVLNPESIPVYLRWVQWISPTKYAFAALAQVEFTGLELHCTDKQLQQTLSPDATIIRFCAVTSGDMVVEKLNIQEFLSLRNCAILLCVLLVAFKILGFFGLILVSRKNMSKVVAKGSAPPT